MILSISARPGGFGNHVRWLLLLDDRFQSSNLYFTGDQQAKVDFILANAYPYDKTWYNWITYEHDFRPAFDELIIHNHFFEKIDFTNFNNYRYIAIQVSPELCYYCHIKFKRNQYKSKEEFLTETAKANEKDKGLKQFLPNMLVLDSDVLFQEELDKTWYNNIITQLGFDNNYKYATIIHKRWYNLHKQAENDIINYLTTLYRTD